MLKKQLYFLHIPKTAGTFISHGIKNSIGDESLSYVSTALVNDKRELKSKIYVSSHSGTYPISLLDNPEVATLVREPVSARASYFNFIYPLFLQDRPEYKEISDHKQRFLYYLFNDKNFLIHNNYQSRFICNPADPVSWNPESFKKDEDSILKKYDGGKGFDWFVGNEKTSLDNALKALSEFKIVNTVDHIDMFCNEIKKWFLLNHNIEINFDKSRINVGPLELDKENVSSEYFASLLNQNEKDRVLELNSIDLEVYNFVKNKESQNV